MALIDFDQRDFDPVSKADWLEKVAKDLKGAEYSALNWKHPDLGEIEPYLTAENDTAQFTLPPRSYQGAANEWQIRQTFTLNTADTAGAQTLNKQILTALAHGVNGLGLHFAEDFDLSLLPMVLKDVYISMLDLTISTDKPHLEHEVNTLLDAILPLSDNPEVALSGSIACDPVTEAFDLRKVPSAQLDDELHEVTQATANHRIRSMRIDAAKYYEAGISDVKEVAIALHLGKLYLNSAQKRGMATDDSAPLFEFALAAGQSYFVTIAKFRALRQMWATLLADAGVKEDCSVVTWIHAVNSRRHYARSDAHNNLLRGTTSAMAAIIGGCDSLEVLPYAPWESPSADQYRWARNIQHLLKEESYLDAVVDPAAGSHYIDTLTNAFIDATAKDFEMLEADGLHKQEGQHTLSEWLRSNKEALEAAFKEEQIVLVGVNKFPPEPWTDESPLETEKGRLHPFRLAELITEKAGA
jgi:methylmalonyl-CoA mutase